jgi:hypothetical protein
MQVREQGLAAAQLRAFRELRFLDLYDEIGGRKDVLGALRDNRAGRLVGYSRRPLESCKNQFKENG